MPKRLSRVRCSHRRERSDSRYLNPSTPSSEKGSDSPCKSATRNLSRRRPPRRARAAQRACAGPAAVAVLAGPGAWRAAWAQVDGVAPAQAITGARSWLVPLALLLGLAIGWVLRGPRVAPPRCRRDACIRTTPHCCSRSATACCCSMRHCRWCRPTRPPNGSSAPPRVRCKARRWARCSTFRYRRCSRPPRRARSMRCRASRGAAANWWRAAPTVVCWSSRPWCACWRRPGRTAKPTAPVLMLLRARHRRAARGRTRAGRQPAALQTGGGEPQRDRLPRRCAGRWTYLNPAWTRSRSIRSRPRSASGLRAQPARGPAGAACVLRAAARRPPGVAPRRVPLPGARRQRALGGRLHPGAARRRRAAHRLRRIGAGRHRAAAGRRALRNQLGFVQQMLEVIPTRSTSRTADGRYIGFNKAWEDFFGYERAKWDGQDGARGVPGPVRAGRARPRPRVLAHPGTQSYESFMSDAHGNTHEILSNKATFHNTDGSVGASSAWSTT